MGNSTYGHLCPESPLCVVINLQYRSAMAQTVKIVIIYQQDGIPVLNVLAGQCDDAADLDSVAERVYGAAANSYMSRLSSSLTLQQVDVISYDDSSEGSFTPATPISGNNGSLALPVNVAVTVSKTLAGTRRKGRMFLPGIPEGAVDSGNSVIPGEQAVIQTFMQNFLTLCSQNQNADGSPGNQPGADVVLGTYTGIPGAAGGFVFRSISGFQTLSRVGSQSRRRDNA